MPVSNYLETREPEVIVLSRPSIDWEAVSRFLALIESDWISDPADSPADRLVELAGRVCYMSFGEQQFTKNNQAYIANLISNGHESVIEHAVWTFVLVNVSRSFSHQLVRHRIGFSYSQMSQQYADHLTPSFVMPSELSVDPLISQMWRESMAKVLEAFEQLRVSLASAATSSGSSLSPKERHRSLASAARSVLPNATTTTIVVTANARSLRHFLKLRGDIAGDSEMRRVCVALLTAIKPDAPGLFGDLYVDTLEDGSLCVKLAKD